MEQAGGMMNCKDVNLTLNEPIHDAVRALDDFPNGRVIDLWNDTP
jgi:hypothetical protein